jgi:hypothetical protein
VFSGKYLRGHLAQDTFRAAVLGAAIVIVIGVPLSTFLNIWLDEAFTLHTTGAGPRVAWAQAIVFEGQPPLYFVLESIWRTLNESSIAFARYPSVVFAAAAVAVIVGAAGRIAPRVPPHVAALVTAFNPIFIWAAVEMRVYALVILIGAILTWSFYEGFIFVLPSRRAQICYTIVAIAGLYVQYYIGFVLAAQFITLLVLRRRELRAFAVAMGVVAAGFAPFLGVAWMHVRSSGDFVLRESLVHSVHDMANAVFVFVFPHDLNWTGASKIAGFGFAAALLIELWAIGRPAISRSPARAIVVQWLACLAIFSVVFAALGAPADFLRHVVVLVPPSLLVAFLYLSSFTRQRVLAGNLAVAAFTVFTFTSLWSQYHAPLNKLGDWQNVAATLRSGDSSVPVAVFPAELAFPLAVYLPQRTIPVPKPMPFSIDYVRATTLSGEAEVSQVLDPVSARSNRLWVVTDGECREGKLVNYNYHCHFMEAYLNRRYRLALSFPFHGSLARLYVRIATVPATSKVARNVY